MTFSVKPLDMISPPNYYGILPNNRWVITSPNGVTLWGQMTITDSLGDRRYIPAVGASLEFAFMRSDSVYMNPSYPMQTTITPQSIVKQAALNTSDRSLFSVVLTQAEVSMITSGSVQFTLTESGTKSVFMQNWAIKKVLTSAGC